MRAVLLVPFFLVFGDVVGISAMVPSKVRALLARRIAMPPAKSLDMVTDIFYPVLDCMEQDWAAVLAICRGMQEARRSLRHVSEYMRNYDFTASIENGSI